MKNLYDYERTQSATTDLPFGALKNESSPGKQDGTDIVAEHIQDLAYSLYQVLQLAGINPNGELEDGNNKTQFIESLTNIGVFRYSDKTSYNYGVFAWQVIGNTFTLYRSLKNSNSDDVNNNESWLKILEIGADNKINFNVDTNILGLSANPSLSNLSEVGEDRLNVSKMYETGAVSNDTKGFKELLKRAHSTFDKSKFKVVGSPTITEDGIANNFTGSSYVSFENIISLNVPSFKIYCKFTTGENVTNTQVVYNSNGGVNGFRLQLTSSKFYLGFLLANEEFKLLTNCPITIEPNTTYYSIVSYDGSKYILKISTNGVDWTTIYDYSDSNLLKESTIKWQIGAYSGGNAFSGTIDLKNFKIVKEDTTIVTGNKTGLYIAKPDNYEKIGDVVVSEDGVASGLSNSNYIKMPNQNWGTENCIEYEFTVTQDMLDNLVGRTDPWILWSTGKGYFVSQYYSKQARFATYYKLTDNSQVNVIVNIDEALKLGDCVKVINKVIAGNQLYLKVTVNGRDYLNTKSVSDNVTYIKDDIKIAGYTNYPYYGSMNLNSVKFYVDGNLVYQPCLKIPYTETFEHPNVVDVAYRNRVQDLYEQTGEALFYTIDEQNQNFTLPSGDIYGMITKNREILDIVYPIGRPMPEENNVLLDNEVWLEGATVNIVDYPKLFKVYGTKYGGDGTTTFKLPDLRNRVLWGSPDGSNGYIEAKLPNIKGGSVLHSQDADGALNGCFYTTRSSISGNAQFPSNGRSYATFGAGINANLSNEIYSDDATTVQPPAFKVRWKTRFE